MKTYKVFKISTETKNYLIFTNYVRHKKSRSIYEIEKSIIPSDDRCSDCERACSAYPYCNGYGYYDNGSQWPGDL